MHSLIKELSVDLQKPAGADPKFSNFESVAKNREEFVLRCHNSWKRWHDEAVHQILVFEGFDKREKKHPIGPAAKEFGNYQRAIWRRVNDSIIWSLVGLQRHVVKRVCLYRKRGYLSESNADSTMASIDAMNANPKSIAIWNDATSCVDVGDVTFVEDGMKPSPIFIELKEGSVNKRILDLLHRDSGTSTFDKQFAEFQSTYGKHGVDQFERVLRQYQTNEQVIDILKTDKGTDPVTGMEIEVLDPGTSQETYDHALNDVLKNAIETRKETMELVGECVWVYVNLEKELGRGGAWLKCKEKVAEMGLHPTHSPTKLSKWDKDRSACLNESFGYPIAKPLFLRALDPEIIAGITMGDLMYRVHLYIDWNKLASIVNSEGGNFKWSSEKQARRNQAQKRELRLPVVGGRMPQIGVGDGLAAITDPDLIQILFDGISPRSITKSAIETARLIQECHQQGK